MARGFNLADIVRAYDNNATERDRAGLNERQRKHVEEAITLFRSEDVCSILEIGSGPGVTAEIFKDNGFEIDCIDTSPAMVSLVQSKGLDGKVMDCRDLGSLANIYDAVFSVNCLLHIPSNEFRQTLLSIREVIRTGGLFVLGLWGGDDFEGIWEEDRYEPKRYFTFYSQRTLLTHLFEVSQIDMYERVEFDDGGFFHKAVVRKSVE